MSQTKALIELFPYKFNIPHYQRGYRWEPQEVTELLNDLWDFIKDTSYGDFYCLQPIVLEELGNNEFNVIDGQQRLTTLYLVLVYLEDRVLEDNYTNDFFELNYETRKKCQEFLGGKKYKTEIDNTNIDFYHICNAYQSINDWFESHPGSRGKFVPILMDKTAQGNRNVRFIWYIIEKGSNPIEVFIRLNIGKISLTDAELTKALLLQCDKYHENDLEFNRKELYKIASEWDSIEYTMQKEEFWYFISNNDNQKPTHIEYILDIIAEETNGEKIYFKKKPSKHSTFLILSKYLTECIENKTPRITAVKEIWAKVVEYFEYFNQWFNDRKLFHYIGFLICEKGESTIKTLLSKAKILSKTEFEEFLKEEIGKVIKVNKDRKLIDGTMHKITLSDLNYENDNNQPDDQREIRKVLLLHNVYSSLKSDKEKALFPFHLYKKTQKNEKWSIEHIHARNSESIKDLFQKKQWLQDHIKSLDNIDKERFNTEILKMKELLDLEKIADEAFDNVVKDIYDRVSVISEITDINKHSLSNLCLLDVRTNSQLNNSLFDVKREIIKKNEIDGCYIPICTRNVFLKTYTEYPKDNVYWTKKDREYYYKSIEKTYNFFTTEK